MNLELIIICIFIFEVNIIKLSLIEPISSYFFGVVSCIINNITYELFI